MDKKKVIIVWSIYKDEGYWYYMFGDKVGTFVTSKKIMTQDMAKKALDAEITKAKLRYGDSYEVTTEELIR